MMGGDGMVCGGCGCSLGKPIFNCDRVDNRWGKLDCGHESACVVKGRRGAPRGS
jgi:hypothetical protein